MAKVIAVVGAGGKTTRIHKLAEEHRKAGKKVFVTTTTHMYREEGCILTGNVEDITRELIRCGYCMAGMPAPHGKIQSLPKAVYETVCNHADVVLVEADGSKGYPVKYPAAHEPVIPGNADEIHIVMGLRAIGHPIGQVCHRKELVIKCLGESEETLLTIEHIERLVEEGYRKPLEKLHPAVLLKICLNKYKKC